MPRKQLWQMVLKNPQTLRWLQLALTFCKNNQQYLLYGLYQPIYECICHGTKQSWNNHKQVYLELSPILLHGFILNSKVLCLKKTSPPQWISFIFMDIVRFLITLTVCWICLLSQYFSLHVCSHTLHLNPPLYWNNLYMVSPTLFLPWHVVLQFPLTSHYCQNGVGNSF